MSYSNGTNPLSFDLTSNERVTFGFKRCLGKGIGGNDEESEGSGMDRVVVGTVDSPHQPTLSKTRSFSDAFAPECLPPLPSSIPKPAFPRSNSEPFPIFPHYSDQVFHDSDDEEEEEAGEEIDVLRQYTNLLSPSPERKKQRLHHIASSPPRFDPSPFDPSPFLTKSTSNSYNFGPFPTGSHDFISTSTAPLPQTEDTPIPGVDRMRSLSMGTGLDLLSLGGLGGLSPIKLPPPPVLELSGETSSPAPEQGEEEEEDEEEAIPAVLTTISPQEAFTSDLSLHPSPTESRKSVAFVEDPIEVPEDKEEEEEESSPLSELSSSSPSPSLSPPPKHGPRFASPLPKPNHSQDDETEPEVDTEEEPNEDSFVRKTPEERAQELLENLSRLLSCPSDLPPGLLELLETSLSHKEKGSDSIAIKLDLLSHSSPRRILRPRPLHSPPQRFLPPKQPTPRSTRSELKVPKKLHPPYPEPFELGWVYETGLDTFEEKRRERNVLRRGGRKVKQEEEMESEGFESDDEGDSERLRGKGRGSAKALRGKGKGRGRGRGRGRNGRDGQVDSE